MKKILALFSVSFLTALPTTQAALVLHVDLSVPNTITINATAGTSAASVSGGTFTGFYLENLFGGAGSSLGHTLVSGNLTTFNNVSDGTPDLFRSGAGADPGLNVWNYSSDGTSSFTSGVQAFSGSATWTISAGSYTEALGGPGSGTVYFPADDAGDIGSATAIGTWSTSLAPAIPEPSTYIAIFGTAGLGAFVMIRRRRQAKNVEAE